MIVYPFSNLAAGDPHGNIFFYSTGSLQTWVVPAKVTTVTAKLYGSSGGAVPPSGSGDAIQATLTVTPGQTLWLVCGNNTGYGGGGTGGRNGTAYGYNGGGYSGIFSYNVISQVNALLIAGGGGGAGSRNANTGGGTAGMQGNRYGIGGGGGGAGTLSVGGAAQTGTGTGGVAATAGSALTGGNAGTHLSSSDFVGGGGGGGYYGGGGGSYGPATADGAGGGGGSSYAASGITFTYIGNNNSTGFINFIW